MQLALNMEGGARLAPDSTHGAKADPHVWPGMVLSDKSREQPCHVSCVLQLQVTESDWITEEKQECVGRTWKSSETQRKAREPT